MGADRMTSPTAELPIRVVRIITRMNIGGPSIHAALLSTRLHPERVSTCLVVGRSDRTEGDLVDSVRGPGVRVVRLGTLQRPLRPWADVASLVQLVRLIWHERPHIIHTHMAKAGALGRVAGILYNRIGPGRQAGRRAALVHTFHGHVLSGYFSPKLSRLFVMIERWLATQTDCLIAVSQAVREDLLQRGIGRPAQWRVIPLGTDLSALAELPLPNGGPPVRFGLVGRLVPIKNPDLFLQAFSRLTRRASAVAGVVVGDGPLRAVLEREVRQLGLSHLIRFTGWQRALHGVYEGLEVTCVTSWNEGTPLALIEAMAAGRAVVATDVGGVRDLLQGDDQAARPMAAGEFQVVDRGLLVRPGDVEGLTAALTVLAQDGGLRRRLGATARSHVCQRFSAERLCRDIIGLYEELTARRGR